MNIELHWPQWTLLSLITLNLLGTLILHGKTRERTYDFWQTLVCIALEIWILYCGGFFK